MSTLAAAAGAFAEVTGTPRESLSCALPQTQQIISTVASSASLICIVTAPFSSAAAHLTTNALLA
jgi:hypothetical protein